MESSERLDICTEQRKNISSLHKDHKRKLPNRLWPLTHVCETVDSAVTFVWVQGAPRRTWCGAHAQHRNTQANMQMCNICCKTADKRTKTQEHISQILASTRWLPVEYRIDFQMWLITFKALHGFLRRPVSKIYWRHMSPAAVCSGNTLLHAPERWPGCPTGVEFLTGGSSFSGLFEKTSWKPLL